jgi:hypothetical protein
MSTVSNFIVADGEDEATWHVELEGGKEAAFQIGFIESRSGSRLGQIRIQS